MKRLAFRYFNFVGVQLLLNWYPFGRTGTIPVELYLFTCDNTLYSENKIKQSFRIYL